MYRRKQKKIETKENKENKLNEEKEQIEEIKPIKEIKNEPIIKAIYKPKTALNYGDVPMVNILRNIDYFNNDENYYSVSFGTLIDICLSKGYLNLKENINYIGDSQTWGKAYINTSNYIRNTFVCGDVIFCRNSHKSFAFLISKVYKSYNYGGNGSSEISSQLDMNPPVGPKADNKDDKILSSLVACDGTVYMFHKGCKLGDIKEHLSTYTSNGELREMQPSNKSEYTGINPEPSFNSKKAGNDELPEYYPSENVIPKPNQDPEYENIYNLKYGTTVEGWFIYMKSTSETELQTPDNIIGDIIFSGPIQITVLNEGKLLSIGQFIQVPYGDGNFGYRGDSSGMNSTPLNSEFYQRNYGDTKQYNSFEGTGNILSLKAIVNHQFN